MKALAPYLIAAILGLALLGGVFYWGWSTSNTAWNAKWTQRDNKDLQAAKDFTDSERRKELKRQADADQIQQDAENQIAKSRAAAAAAAAESKRLQSGITDAIKQLRGYSSNTGSTASSAAGDKAGLLLAELFGEIDNAAGNYAAEADRAYNAGIACERTYDAVRAK